MCRHQLKLGWRVKRLDEKQAQHKHLTHEQFVHEVAKLGIGLLGEDDRKVALQSKLTYGAGARGLRGVTYFNNWLNNKDEQAHFVEICAHGEENPVQLAGTTLHELGHVVAGWQAGHKKEWHQACDKLGLRAIKAAGTSYLLSMFDPRIRAQVAALIDKLNDGKPNGSRMPRGIPKPCSAGIGTRGGTSRGVGSGSRLRKWVCACQPKPVIARVASDDFQATCNRCNEHFTLAIE